MPFYMPFKDKFEPGDLIYGLGRMRGTYVEYDNTFIDANTNRKKRIAPPCYVDYYRIQKERVDSMYTGNELNRYNQYKDSFFNHMKSENINSKYHNIATTPRSSLGAVKEKFNQSKEKNMEKLNEINNWINANKIAGKKIIGRKCKMGLSWVCTSDDKLVERCHIHFILDGIDINKLISKQDNHSITGKELRWIFRNRHNPKVAQKIQFWFDRKPVTPPWVKRDDAPSILNFWHKFESQKTTKNLTAWENYGQQVTQKQENKEKKLEKELYEGLSEFFDKY